MNQVFPQGSPRYLIAMALVAQTRLTMEALMKNVCEMDKTLEMPTVRAHVGSMTRHLLINRVDGRIGLTERGLRLWLAQSEASGLVAQPAPTDARATLSPLHDVSLLTRGIARLSSPANRHPFKPREGSMDFADHPRIFGNWRVWPDGRREPIDGKDAA